MSQNPLEILALAVGGGLLITPDEAYKFATRELVGRHRRCLYRVMDRTRRKKAPLDHFEARQAVRDIEPILATRMGSRDWKFFLLNCVELASAKYAVEAQQRVESTGRGART